jgi:group I intron endonuclease
MKNVIYKIRNVTNEKFYVGSTNNTRERFRAHRNKLRGNKHHCKHLQAAWNKYGEDCFKFEVIEQVASSDLLFAAEDIWLSEWFGHSQCYNSGRSAAAPMRGIPKEQHPSYGRQKSADEKIAISTGLKDYYANNISHRLGATLTVETLLKIKENRVAPKGDAHYGYGLTRSEETKAKISAAQLGVKKPTGRKVSEEGLVKMRAAVKRGADSHFYGQRPASADLAQKPIRAIKRDRSEEIYKSLSFMRDTLGVSVATIIRACNSGNPIRQGVCDGWVLSYASEETNVAPEIPEEYLEYPRTRQEAKELGAKLYFTGIPCERGHISPRKAKGTCVICMKEDYKKDKRLKINLHE